MKRPKLWGVVLGVILLLAPVCSKTYAATGVWSNLGASDFSNTPGSNFISLRYAQDGTAYAAFQAIPSSGWYSTVYRYRNNAWQRLPDIVPVTATSWNYLQAMTLDDQGRPYVVCNNGVVSTIKRFDETQGIWVQVGNSISNKGISAIAVDNATVYVAGAGTGTKPLVLLQLTPPATTYTEIPIQVPGSFYQFIKLERDIREPGSRIFLAAVNNTNTIDVWGYSSAWSRLPSLPTTYSMNGVADLSMTVINSVPYIAYSFYDPSKSYTQVAVNMLNQLTWDFAGGVIGSPSQSLLWPSITVDNLQNIFVSFSETTSQSMQLFQLQNTSWTQYGGVAFAPGTNQSSVAIGTDNNPYIAYFDSLNNNHPTVRYLAAPPTATNTVTSTFTSTPTATNSPTNTFISTATATNSQTNTFTSTATATNSQTNTFTSTATATNSPTNTFTSTATATNSPTKTFTSTATATNSPTNTFTATATPTNSPTNTFTATATPTNSPTNTFTATATATNSPTNTFTPTPTRTITYTPTRTITSTVTSTSTPTDGITICLVIVNKDGTLADNDNLADTSFSIPLYDQPQPGYPKDPSSYGTSSVTVKFKAPFIPNTTILDTETRRRNNIGDDKEERKGNEKSTTKPTSKNDAICQKVSFSTALKIPQSIAYGQLSTTSKLNWEKPKYNDQYTKLVDELRDFFFYDNSLFDGKKNNEKNRNQNADGHISVTTKARLSRPLVILARQSKLQGRKEIGQQ
ncbi:MAG: hypothetical protein WCP97_04320 [bacterium]